MNKFSLSKSILKFFLDITFLAIAYISAVLIKIFKLSKKDNPRLVWGSVPIINNKYWSKSMKDSGYFSETFTQDFYKINSRHDWDFILSEKYLFMPYRVKLHLAFIESLYRYDVFLYHVQDFLLRYC